MQTIGHITCEIEEKSKTRDFATSIGWLTMAHIVNQSYQLKEHITMPLMADNDSNFRLYLGDIGMFSYQSGINAASSRLCQKTLQMAKWQDHTVGENYYHGFCPYALTA